MPLNPDARAFLERMRNSPQPDEVPIAAFREAARALIPSGPALEIGRVEQVTIAGGDKQDLQLRIYVPEGAGPFPVIVWMHGGSFVRGTFDLFDPGRRALAKMSCCVIVAVDQRLSPECTFPAPLEDGYAALKWVSTHAVEFSGSSSVLGVGGESSGGNLAAALALLARERGGPRVTFQVLLEPVLDAHCESPSISEFGVGYVLTKRQMVWMYQQYAPQESPDNPLLSPLRAPDLTNLPSAVIVTIEYDPARDDGERYADRLNVAGVTVRQARIAGMVHHFPGPELVPTAVRLLHELLPSTAWQNN